MADVDFVRTPDDRFAGIGWEWSPHYFEHPDGLRQHYVDERPGGEERGTFLLLHGEPSWAYLYKDWIGPLVADGYRVVAPDHLGFGRSDKPTDDDWYTIARHREALARLVDALDLDRIHLVVQDWAGPIGLINAVADPDRYARLFILNTWLHADDHEYSEGVKWWRQAAIDPENRGFEWKTKVAFNVGMGFRVFFNRWLAAYLEIRDYAYSEPLENTAVKPQAAPGTNPKGTAKDPDTWYGESRFTNAVQAQFGISIFLPFTWQYKLPK